MATRYATIETNRGTIVAEVFSRDCPGTADHFQQLANAGFYDGVRFHEVEAGRVAHTGDPLSRTLPPGETPVDGDGLNTEIPGEIVGNRNTHERGALSMELDHRGVGHGRFFFVLDSRVGDTLDGKHTVFGMVEEGIDVLDRIEPLDVVNRIRVWE
jgi:peptidyl-prolyl cis-trans isomerase B (cyclophilin B)